MSLKNGKEGCKVLLQQDEATTVFSQDTRSYAWDFNRFSSDYSDSL